jgi:hypothetical protein
MGTLPEYVYYEMYGILKEYGIGCILLLQDDKVKKFDSVTEPNLQENIKQIYAAILLSLYIYRIHTLPS